MPGVMAPLDYGQHIGSLPPEDFMWSYNSNTAMLYTSNSGYPHFYITYDGEWNGLSGNYIGCRLTMDSLVYYGWIQLSVDMENNVTLVDYAYENNPDTAIAAGDVPEPSILLLLSAGFWRISRRER